MPKLRSSVFVSWTLTGVIALLDYTSSLDILNQWLIHRKSGKSSGRVRWTLLTWSAVYRKSGRKSLGSRFDIVAAGPFVRAQRLLWVSPPYSRNTQIWTSPRTPTRAKLSLLSGRQFVTVLPDQIGSSIVARGFGRGVIFTRSDGDTCILSIWKRIFLTDLPLFSPLRKKYLCL